MLTRVWESEASPTVSSLESQGKKNARRSPHVRTTLTNVLSSQIPWARPGELAIPF